MIDGKIGVEIECIVPEKNTRKLKTLCTKNNWAYTSDGSIRGYTSTEVPVEFKAGVYDISNKKVLFREVDKAMKLIRVHESCGLHMHLSFNNLTDYWKLLSYEFADYFQKLIKIRFVKPVDLRRLEAMWCKFYYSQDDFKKQTQEQLRTTQKNNRYFAVNYNSFNIHNTIEFRIFAATSNIEQFKSDVDFLLNSVEEFLNRKKFEGIAFEVKYKKPKVHTGPIVIKEVIKKDELNSLGIEGVENDHL